MTISEDREATFTTIFYHHKDPSGFPGGFFSYKNSSSKGFLYYVRNSTYLTENLCSISSI